MARIDVGSVFFCITTDMLILSVETFLQRCISLSPILDFMLTQYSAYALIRFWHEKKKKSHLVRVKVGFGIGLIYLFR